jgi:vancomycin permeability regulator SanA
MSPLALVLLGVASLAGCGAVGVTWLRIHRRGRSERPRPAEAIVVFGASAGRRGPSPELAGRLEEAANLFARGYAPVVLCSGGRSRGVSEPQVMRESLIRLGVPSEAIRLDESGTSTRRTVTAARRFGHVLVVSSPYHVHRILAEARRQRLDAVAGPAHAVSAAVRPSKRLRAALREVAAVWWYALRGRLAPVPRADPYCASAARADSRAR